ncbi:MAG: aminotransferase class V-fold PLP-dependent enzyme [Balneolaceae bacterium]|nr:aminotransferase class V-fold PLP-dependent enzyme [Balneolaceae bacterium]
MELLNRLQELEQDARKLEIEPSERYRLTETAVSYTKNFLNAVDEKKAFEETEDKARPLLDHPFTEDSAPFDKLLELLDREVNHKGLNPTSPNHMGYIPGGGLYPSAVADFLAAVTNRYAGMFFSAPGAVRMENMCIRWMCDLVGYPEGAAGNLTSGGSIANLIALVTARDSAGLRSADFENAVIYITRQVHHCAIKAFRFAGMADATIRHIPMDAHFRIRPDLLRQQVAEDKKEGLNPFMIFSSAGTTDIGAVDPLQELADIADEHSLWFHVDAAYGGFFLLTEHGRQKMRGIDRADSVIIDPHKGLFLPYGSGALMVRDGKKLYDSQHMEANYLQDTHKATGEYSPADLSPELSKHFRGLRMWLPLKLFGVKPFRTALEEKRQLTHYFYDKIREIDGIEVGPEPELSVMFFRYLPEEGDPNTFNKKLVDAIHKDGRVFLSSTHIEGRIYLRLAVLNFRTHLEHIKITLQVIREKIAEIKDSG